MLAGPEQDERGCHRRPVAAASRVAYTGEEAASSLGVADVWWRYRALTYECVTERDVPRVQRVQLAVEVLAAVLKSCVAVHHLRESGERERCSADTCGTADQCRDVLDVELARRPLGKVLPEGVVELVEGGVGGSLRAPDVVGVSFPDQQPRCGADVDDCALVRGSERPGQQRSRTARPEEETAPQADGATV